MVTREGWWPHWFDPVVNDGDGALRTLFTQLKQPTQQTIIDFLNESRLVGTNHSELVNKFNAKVRDLRDNAPNLREL